MKTVVRIAGALLGVVVILVVVGAFLPSERTVSRSIEIDAPPATVFALVNGFRHFNRFSPWAGRDPRASYSYSGPTEGVGATMAWASEPLGNGEQEITASIPLSRVEGVIRFDGQGSADIAFDIEPVPAGSKVTWTFHIDVGWNLVDRYFGLLMEDFVGNDYEEGLENLKRIAEEYPRIDLADFDPGLGDVDSVPLVMIRKRTVMDAAAMEESMYSAFEALDTILLLNDLEPAGMPRVITREWDEEGGTWTFDAAYELPPASPITRSAPGIDRENSYGGLAMQLRLVGPDWQESTLAYERAALYQQLHGLEPAGDSWEAYESDMRNTPAEELVTNIVIPVKRMAPGSDD